MSVEGNQGSHQDFFTTEWGNQERGPLGGITSPTDPYLKIAWVDLQTMYWCHAGNRWGED